jgi:hypothetical protein
VLLPGLRLTSLHQGPARHFGAVLRCFAGIWEDVEAQISPLSRYFATVSNTGKGRGAGGNCRAAVWGLVVLIVPAVVGQPAVSVLCSSGCTHVQDLQWHE